MAESELDQILAEAEALERKEAEDAIINARDYGLLSQMRQESAEPSIADRVGAAAVLGGVMPQASESVLPMMWEGVKTGADTLAGMVIPPKNFIEEKLRNPYVTVSSGEQVSIDPPTAQEQATGLGLYEPKPVADNTLVDPVAERERRRIAYRESSIPAFLHSLAQDDFIAPVQRFSNAAVYGTVDWAKSLAEQAVNDPASIAPEIVAATVKIPGAKQGASTAMRYSVKAGEALARSFVETATESGIAEIDPEFAQRLEADGTSRERFMKNLGEYALYTMGGEAIGDFAKVPKAVKEIADERVDAAFPKAAGFSSKFSKRDLTQTGTRLEPTAKSLLSNPDAVDFEIRSQATRSVKLARELGLFDNYTTPLNFLGKVKDVEARALQVREQIFNKAQQSLTERVTKGAPAPEVKLPVLKAQLERLLIEDPAGPLTTSTSKIIKRIENVVGNTLTKEKAQEIALKRGLIDKKALDLTKPRTGSKLEATGEGLLATRTRNPRWGSSASGELVLIGPGELDDIVRYTPLTRSGTRTLPPVAEAPATAQLSTLYGLRSSLGKQAVVFWAGGKDQKGYKDAATLAAARKEIDNIIEDYLGKLQKSGALTEKEIKALRETDKLLEMTNTIAPWTREYAAGIDDRVRGTTKMPGLEMVRDFQNEAGKRIAAANVSGRGIMQDPAALFTARTMGNVASGIATGAEKTQQFMGNVPLRLAAQLEQEQQDRPLPRNVDDFFSLPFEEIQRKLPSVAQDFDVFAKKTPEEKRYFLQQAVKGNPDLFEPSPIAGFSFVDGRIDPDQREAFLQKLNKDMKTPGADMRYYAALIRQIGRDEPVVDQKRSSVHAFDRLVRLFQDTPFDVEMDGDIEMQGAQLIATQQ